jgi:uncharacterized C2H2 Zn-finger protein
MRIGIEINGVLRNTIGKIEQTYQKFMIDKTEGIEDENSFEYKMNLPVTSLNLKDHFSFENEDELYSFLYEEFPMEIFGHAQSTEYTTFNDLNEIYLNLRDNNDLTIVSDEMGKSKPASLFFLSKFGCLLEKVKFYSNNTINSMWDEIDVLLTSNPTLLLECPSNKFIIKYETEYNKHINWTHSITTLKELEQKLKEMELC